MSGPLLDAARAALDAAAGRPLVEALIRGLADTVEAKFAFQVGLEDSATAAPAALHEGKSGRGLT
jgi:hypothetical protein